MDGFANWLQGTSLSTAIQSTLWMVPAIQCVHIIAIGVLVGAFFMVDMRVLGVVGRDQSVAQVSRRYAPWFWCALLVLLTTGVLLIIGEPRRELLSFSFWAKMALLAIGIVVALVFQQHLRSDPARWEGDAAAPPLTKVLALLSILVWIGIMFMGRFIAFDAQMWGTLSPQA